MRFADIRPTVIKNTGAEAPIPKDGEPWPTPRYLSPRVGLTRTLREGVDAADILNPGYNRARRRALGLRRGRRRLSAQTTQFSAPWLRSREIQA